METYSVLSQAAYTFNDNGGDVESTEQEIRDYGLEGYTIDRELSDDESLVLFNDQGQEVTLAVRGTDPDTFDPEDWYANALIFTGSDTESTERFYGEYDKMRKIMKKYPGAKHVVTGHSLGGHISYKLGRDLGVEGHHFNAAASVREVFENLMSVVYCGDDCEALKKQHFYSTAIDPISFWNMHPVLDQFGEQNIHYQYRPDQGYMGHSINHFLPPKKGVENDRITYTSHIEQFKDEQKRGVLQMVRPQRIKPSQDPVSRDYCSDNPKDPRCLLSSRLRNR